MPAYRRSDSSILLAVSKKVYWKSDLSRPAPPLSGLYALRVESDIDLAVLDLQLVDGHAFYGGKAFCFSGRHVEGCAVQRTFDLTVREEFAFREVDELVGADVLEGVELAVYVDERDGAILDGKLLHPARRNFLRRGEMVEFFLRHL